MKSLLVSTSDQVSCDFVTSNWDTLKTTLRTCNIVNQTVDSQQVNISSLQDSTAKGLNIRDEKDVIYLPANVAELYPNLVAVSIFNCSLKSTNKQICNKLLELRYLNFGRNKIKMVESEAFAKLTKLEYLALGWNQIELISEQAFKSLTNLKKLYLHDNRIQWLNSKLLLPLKSVENVNFDRNEIKILNWELLSGLTNLKNISFDSNEIEEIKSKSIVKNGKLEKIWLNNNKLRFVDSKIFVGKTNLYFAQLQNNTCVNKSYDNSSLSKIEKDLKAKCLPLEDRLTISKKLKVPCEKSVESVQGNENITIFEQIIFVLFFGRWNFN